ncbi:MAG: ABC transporter permease [Euryarchaeota archaeon]|nr:ABC transporter permease [Euryarchaeota archaeon]
MSALPDLADRAASGLATLDYPALLFTFLAFAAMVAMARLVGLRMGREALIAAVRGTIQLLIVGLVFLAVVEEGSPYIIGLVFLVMVVAAGWTATATSRRTGLFPLASLVITVATALLVVPLVLLDLFETRPLFLIPVAGMVIGNAMNATALGLDRMERELAVTLPQTEARLALGYPERATVLPALRETVHAALLPTMNTLRTVGLVHLPGMMTGMLLAGADPLFAVEMQLVIILVILVAAFLASATMALVIRERFVRDLSAVGLDDWREKKE